MSFFELSKKVAEIQFTNRDLHLLYRGQPVDYKTKNKGASLLKASIFRLEGGKLPTSAVIRNRFKLLRQKERELLIEYNQYKKAKLPGVERLRRYRSIRWAILQHYDVCATPLLDVTQSLRVAASFAMLSNQSEEGFIYVFGVPSVSGAVTASSEAGLQILRLSSACPPDAARPHLQEGYLLGEYPELSDLDEHNTYEYHELDFGRRLVAKFKFNPFDFRDSGKFVPLDNTDFFPNVIDDPLREICEKVISNTNKKSA